jgi:ABC-type nitrate/sulfonate/bicarbonate transport system substrate-binding protein
MPDSARPYPAAHSNWRTHPASATPPIERQPAAAAAFLAAWQQATRYVLDPANQEAVLTIIQSRLGVPPDIALATLASAIDPSGGLVPNGMPSDADVETLLKLRNSVVPSHQPQDDRSRALTQLVDSRYPRS